MVSRQNQRLEPKQDALLVEGCEMLSEGKVSSREADRKALRETFVYCREHEVLVVARLVRLGRSFRELIHLVRELENSRVGVAKILRV
jgi:DNA invertase Pin-like site-specific DNA recombinase